jgi:preprotein translocase subunit SecE
MVKKRKSPKKRKPKGKPLSEQLHARDAERAALDEELSSTESGSSGTGSDAGEPGAADDDEDPYREDDDEPRHDDDERQDEEAAGADEDDGAGDASDDGEAKADDEDAATDRDGEDDDEDGDDEDGDDEDGDGDVATHLGYQRFVLAGFFGAWVVGAYVLGRTTEALWSYFASKDWFVAQVPRLAAVPHEGELISRSSVGLLVGALLAAGIVWRYWSKSDTRVWADEVADELSKVKWPTRKEIGNHTVVVIAASAVLTVYLTLLDRFWGFVTNLIYSTGA